ncbi:RNase adapter RapZ [Jatrophihabitans endophyticus]|uniref:RNase adapter RapZ n=1 Tax=Jatrophihabitans endophyticus TaxID=1206085 RepID=UPI0019E134C0|nr:RNase adapter RapZ [Jatrophihabitans endophyticus]MBE7186955.1 RNase adapter RapZ [Jatrophihabitans endophyticus]
MGEPEPRAEQPEGALETVIITGLSGAGRSAAAKCFEDLGFFVVDNLPPALIGTLVDLGSRSQGAVTRLAVVMDVRSRGFSKDLRSVIRELADRRMRPRVVFLEAHDDVLVRRFEAVRREHPLQHADERAGGRLVDGIAAERALLAGLRDEADLIIDTSDRSVHDLRRVVESAFTGPGANGRPELRATVLSFGYKYGLPVDADLVVDVRFLPNPYWIPELRELNGRDQPVSDYVLSQEGAGEFIERYTDLLRIIGAGYRRESKRYLTLAVGCTGGKHRSVAISQELARRLEAQGVETTVVHRDLGRE